MGLHGVEIIMAVEQTFGITIADEEAQELTTPRELVDLVMAKVAVTDKPSCLSQRAFHLLRRQAMASFKVPRKEFRLDTQLEEIVPKRERRKTWAEFRRNLQATHWPELVRAPSLLAALVGVTIVGSAMAAYFVGLATGWGALAFLAAAFLIGCVATLATRPLRISFPLNSKTVRELTQFMVARNAHLLGVTENTWTRERVWCVVRDILVEQTGLTNFTEDSHFVRDMHIDE